MPLNISIDVDGTLLDENENPIPQARNTLQQLKSKGHRLQLWSTGGADYAHKTAVKHQLADLFDSYGTKPDVAIDDMPESVRPVATMRVDKDNCLTNAIEKLQSQVEAAVESSLLPDSDVVSHVRKIKAAGSGISRQHRVDLAIRPTPIPFFGNIGQARVVTIGLNPSWSEFQAWRGWRNNLSDSDLAFRLVNYFRLANVNFPPAHKWFGEILEAMHALEFPYSVAGAHMDLCPWATHKPTELMTRTDRRRLVRLFWEFLDGQMDAWFQETVGLCRKTVRLVILLQSQEPSRLELERQDRAEQMIRAALGEEWSGKIRIKTKEGLPAWAWEKRAPIKKFIDFGHTIS